MFKLWFSLYLTLTLITSICCNYLLFLESIKNSENKYETQCLRSADCLDIQFVCSNNRCICDNNYIFDVNDNSCKHFICHINSDCQERDANRQCRSGQCMCGTDLWVDAVTKLCVERPGYDYSWLWCLLFLIPSIVASIHGIHRKYQILKQNS